MKKSLLMLTAAAWATLLLASTSVRADSISWGYSASDVTIFNNNNPTQTSSIKFAGSSGVATGDSGIIVYNLTTNSTATDGTADSFSNVPFNLGVTFTDIKATSSVSSSAKASDTINLAGLFNATNVTTKSLLPGVNSWTSPTTANLVLGADDVGWRNYQVTLSSFTPPGQPGGAPGSIQAIVTITPVDGPEPPGEVAPSAAPEPASILLAGLGLPVVVLMRRRQRSAQ